MIDNTTTHKLKCHPLPFQAIWDGRKRFEYRLNDRNYLVGDRLVLMEFDPATGRYSGREIYATICYGMASCFGLPEGYVVLSLSGLVNKTVSGTEVDQDAKHQREVNELIKRGVEMRNAQRSYFKGKSSDSLLRAKTAEGYFDKILEYFTKKNSPTTGEQKNLF